MTATPIEWVSPEQAGHFTSVLDFAQTLSRDVRQRDADGAFPRADWDACGAFGLMGLPVPPEQGGLGLDVVSTMLALEAFGEGCVDGGLVFSVNAHLWTSVVPLWRYGSPEQQTRWLDELASGRSIGCHAITEPEAGSDPFAMRASATKTDGGWALTGQKMFITNAPEADLLVIFARTGEGEGPLGISAFLVEAGTPGCEVGPPTEKMGLRTSPMGEIFLDGCVVPDDALLGREGRAAEIFNESMRWERPGIMASQVGAMRRTLQECVSYARQREQFGKPIGKFESVADKIADMKVAVDASRALVLRVGWMMDQGLDTTSEAAVAKLFVSEAAVRTQLDAIQIHGGYGYLSESQIERGLRDAVGGTIYSGTSEIQRRIIARGLGL